MVGGVATVRVRAGMERLCEVVAEEVVARLEMGEIVDGRAEVRRLREVE